MNFFRQAFLSTSMRRFGTDAHALLWSSIVGAIMISMPLLAQVPDATDVTPSSRPLQLDVQLLAPLLGEQLHRGDSFEAVLAATAQDDLPIGVRGKVLGVVIGEGDFDQLTLTLSEVEWQGAWRPLTTETLLLRRERSKGGGWLKSSVGFGALAGRVALASKCIQVPGLEEGVGGLFSDGQAFGLAENSVLTFVVADDQAGQR